MPDNPELHGRNLFLQLLGIVNCKPQLPNPPPNLAPIAFNDTVKTLQGEPVTIPVLANDSDPNNDPLNVISKTAPLNGGTATLNPDGTITYTPPSPDFCDEDDTFEYTISDGKGEENTALVTVTVDCCAFVVTANDDSATTVANTPVNVPVLDNDTTDPAGGPLSAGAIATQPTNGSVKIVGADASAKIVGENTMVEYTANKDYCGLDSFVYTASSDGGQDDALVTVTVKCVIANDDTETTAPKTPVKIQVLDNDTGVPAGQILKVVDTPTLPQFGTVTINEDNTITYTPTPESGKCDPQDTFTYKVDGDDGATDTATVTVTITCPTPVKVTAVDDAIPTSKNLPVEIKVLGNDTTEIRQRSMNSGQYQDATYQRIGQNYWNNKIVEYTTKQDYCGVDTFEYVAKVPQGGEDAALVTVTIQCVKANPDMSTTTRGTPVKIDVLKNDGSNSPGQ
jgi:hypothetical protein